MSLQECSLYAWSKYECLLGPDNQMENKTKESTGKFAELKCTCTLEGNLNEICFKSLRCPGVIDRVRLAHISLGKSIGSPRHLVQCFSNSFDLDLQ